MRPGLAASPSCLRRPPIPESAGRIIGSPAMICGTTAPPICYEAKLSKVRTCGCSRRAAPVLGDRQRAVAVYPVPELDVRPRCAPSRMSLLLRLYRSSVPPGRNSSAIPITAHVPTSSSARLCRWRPGPRRPVPCSAACPGWGRDCRRLGLPYSWSLRESSSVRPHQCAATVTESGQSVAPV